jgi:hypothetical protein
MLYDISAFFLKKSRNEFVPEFRFLPFIVNGYVYIFVRKVEETRIYKYVNVCWKC